MNLRLAPRQGTASPDAQPGVHTALQLTLSIATATSDQELTARAVEAAGRLTRATVAWGQDAAGHDHTWGDAAIAARLTRTSRALRPGDLRADTFAPIGLPAAIIADAPVPLVVAAADAQQFAADAAHMLSLVVAHAEVGRDRLHELAKLSRLADRDPLTGLRHYRPFEERLASSQPGRTAVMAVDIDNFKQINDRYGHQAGDDALLTLVGALRRALRGDDHIYRIGGDEFAIVVDVGSVQEITGITRRLLLAARTAGYPISIGAALRQPAETGREALLRADRALYEAKHAGRNTAHLAA